MANKTTIIGTGLSGMVGSRLVELYKHKYDFVNLDLTTGLDITDPTAVDRALAKIPATTVIHLAAFTDVSRAYQEKNNKDGLVYKVNVVGTKNIAQSCHQHGHYLIHISTDFVFDGSNPPPTGYIETDKPHPIEWYGQTKLWAEQAVLASSCRHSIARLAFPFRSYFPQKLDLVRTIISKLKDDCLYPMFSDQIITPTFIDDVCSALNIFIQSQPSGIYHLVGSSFISPFDLAQKINQLFALKGKVKPGSFQEYLKKDPRPRQQFTRLCNQKLKKDLGIDMKTIDQALQALKLQLNSLN